MWLNNFILVAATVSPILLVSCKPKLIPIVRLTEKETGISVYALNDEDLNDMTKKGFTKMEDSGFIIAPESVEEARKECPELKPIVRVPITFTSHLFFRLYTSLKGFSQAVIGYAVNGKHCGATEEMKEFKSKIRPDHVYVMLSEKKKYPSRADFVMSGTPFFAWPKNFKGNFASETAP